MKKRIIMITSISLIVAALIFIPQAIAGSRRTALAAPVSSSHVFTVRTETAEMRTLQAYIEVNANIVSGNQVVVMPEANGRLASMRVGLGDIVSGASSLPRLTPPALALSFR